MKKSLYLPLMLGALGTFCMGNQQAIGLAENAIAPSVIAQTTSPQPTAPTAPKQPISPEQPTVEPSTVPQSPNPLYDKLKQALSAGDLRAADQITYELMLEIAGPRSQASGRFDEQEWAAFSCKDLKQVDQLWVEATQNTQGFSVQKQVFEQVKRVPLAYRVRVGWQRPSGAFLVSPSHSTIDKTVAYKDSKEPNYTKPPIGHLPAKLAWWDKHDRRFGRIYPCGL